MVTRFRGLARLINSSTSMPGLRSLVRWSAGVDHAGRCRALPIKLARSRIELQSTDGGPAIIWVDSFSDCFTGDGSPQPSRC